MASFRVRGSYIHHTKISSVLDHDVVFQANIRALCAQRPPAEKFAMHRNWLVRAALARFRRQQSEMALARAGAQRLERELVVG